jgi:hypothetical protein
VAVAIPGVADATVRLDILLGGMPAGVARGDPGDSRRDRQFCRLGRQRPGTVIGVGARQFDCHVDVRQLVLDRLERPDRPPERIALQRIVPGHVECGLCGADLLERHHHCCSVDQPLHVTGASRPFQRICSRAIEAEASQ